MIRILLCLGVVGLLGACQKGLKLDVENAQNCPAYLEGYPGAELADENCEAIKEVVAKTAEDVPAWMLKLPEDDKAFYSAGTAVSRDMQLAIDKANLAAKRNLADRIGGELSSQIKEFVIESGDMYSNDLITVDVERVTKNVMARINVAGYVPYQMEVYPLGTMYRVYTLIAYPIGARNDILIEQIRRNRALYAHVRSSVAFNELEKEVDEKRERDVEDLSAIVDSASGPSVE